MDLHDLVTRLAPGLLRYCLGKTGDRSLAEELSQEALTALVARWRKHGPPDNPEAFVFTIARRRAGRGFWRRRLTGQLDGGLDGQLDGAEPAGGAAPDQRAELRSELAAVRQALARLPRRDREVLLLVAAGELDTRAASEVLAISPSALKMRLHRARLRLTQRLEKDHERSIRLRLAERA